MSKERVLPSDKELSVFAAQVYFNYNHNVTETQLILRFHSMDTASERSLPIYGKPLKDYNGYRFIKKFLDQLDRGYTKVAKDGTSKTYPPGQLWYAVISWNRFLDSGAKTPDGRMKNVFIEEVYGNYPKNFTTPEERQRIGLLENELEQ